MSAGTVTALRLEPRPGNTRRSTGAPRTIAVEAKTSTTARRTGPRWRSQSNRLSAKTAKNARSSATLSRVSSVMPSDRCSQGLDRPDPRGSDLLRRMLDHREEEPHQVWIELRAGLALELDDRLVDRSRRPVGPIVDDRVEGVDEAHDPCTRGDPLAAKAVRIPGAIPALVVVADDRGELRRRREGLADSLADQQMEAHL